MKIAVVTPLFPMRAQPWRGSAVYLTVLELSRMAEIEVFVPVSKYPDARGLRPTGFEQQRPDPAWQPESVITHYFEYRTLPLLGRLWNGWASGNVIRRAVSSFNPDLVLAYWLYPEGYGALNVASSLGIPCVVGARGSDLRRITDSITRHCVRRTLRGASHSIAVSDDLRQIAIRDYGLAPERISRIGNGCDTNIFRPQPRNECRAALGLSPVAELVVYVGNLLSTKGLNELWMAFSQLAARRPRLELALIGEGTLRADFTKWAGSANLDERVHMPGSVDRTEVATWIGASNVFTLPSYSEGCPNVVLEALACARIVVATRVGGIPEILPAENGILVEPRDAAALAAALEQALDRPWDESAIKSVSRRSWAVAARETLAICTQALAANSLSKSSAETCDVENA